MSGSGKVIEKYLETIDGKDVLRYRVMSEYRPDWFDETFVRGERDGEEPRIGETIEWLGEWIYFAKGAKKIKKVGYSWSADRTNSP